MRKFTAESGIDTREKRIWGPESDKDLCEREKQDEEIQKIKKSIERKTRNLTNSLPTDF